MDKINEKNKAETEWKKRNKKLKRKNKCKKWMGK